MSQQKQEIDAYLAMSVADKEDHIARLCATAGSSAASAWHSVYGAGISAPRFRWICREFC